MSESKNHHENARNLEQAYIIQLTKENRALTDVWKELHNSLESQLHIALEESKRLEIRNKTLYQENSKIQNENVEARKKYDLDIITATNKLESLKTSLENRESENIKLTEAIKKYNLEIKRLETDNKEKIIKIKNEENALHEEISAKNKLVKQLESINRKIEKENKKLSAELLEAKDKHEIFNNDVKEYKDELKEVKKAMKDQKKEFDQIIKKEDEEKKVRQKEFETEKKEIIDNYEMAINELKEQLSKTADTQSDLTNNTKIRATELRKLKRDYEEKIAKIDKEYKNRINEKNQQIDELEYDLYTKKDAINSLHEKEKEIETLRSEVKELKKTNFDTTKEYNKLKKEIVALREMNELAKSNRKIQMDNKEESKQLLHENEQLKTQLKDIQTATLKQVEDLKLQNHKLKEENKENKKKLELRVNAAFEFKNEMEKNKSLAENTIIPNNLNNEVDTINNERSLLGSDSGENHEDKIAEMKAQMIELQKMIHTIENKGFDGVEAGRNKGIPEASESIEGHVTKNTKNKSEGKKKVKKHAAPKKTQVEVSNTLKKLIPLKTTDLTQTNDAKNTPSETVDESINTSLRKKRKPRSRITCPKRAQKRTKQNNYKPIATSQNSAHDVEEPIEKLLSESNFCTLPAKIGGLFDDLTFTEESSIFGKKSQ